jgi:hypothetical protein
MVHRNCQGQDEDALAILSQINPAQMATALAYADAYPEEIAAWLSETAKTPEQWKKIFPPLRSNY